MPAPRGKDLRITAPMFVLTYSLLAYTAFLLVSLYAIGFVGAFLVPWTIDGPQVFAVSQALPVDLGLLLLFGLQHSVMARPQFKRYWTRWIPEAIERSTYVLFSSLLLMACFVFWRPVGGMVWQAAPPYDGLLRAGYAIGWGVLMLSSFMISHAELFGLKQAWHALRRQPMPAQPFRIRWLYKRVRHPIMLGFLMAFWVTPAMTVGHLIFSVGMTVYILIGLFFEERDLVKQIGEPYRAYQAQVPKLIPRVGKSSAVTTEHSGGRH